MNRVIQIHPNNLKIKILKKCQVKKCHLKIKIKKRKIKIYYFKKIHNHMIINKKSRNNNQAKNKTQFKIFKLKIIATKEFLVKNKKAKKNNNKIIKSTMKIYLI